MSSRISGVNGQVIRATFSHNLSRNIVALQVEKRCFPYYYYYYYYYLKQKHVSKHEVYFYYGYLTVVKNILSRAQKSFLAFA